MSQDSPQTDFIQLAEKIHAWSEELGFQQLGITDTAMDTAEVRLLEWLDNAFHGEMDDMAIHGSMFSRL